MGHILFNCIHPLNLPYVNLCKEAENIMTTTDEQWAKALALLNTGRYTQAQVARGLGVSRDYVSKVARGERKPHLTQQPDLPPDLPPTTKPTTKPPTKQRYQDHTGYTPRPATIQAKIQRLLYQTTYDPNQGECWNWTGYITPKGQPRTTYNKRSMTPQRKLYLLQGRPLPPTHKITNRCGNPLCCNPAHIIAIPKRKLPKLNLRRGY